MRTAIHAEPLIRGLEVTDRAIVVQLVDGRVVSVPLDWSWRLSQATPAERTNFRISGDGAYVHWPDVDEDLSAQGMLTGTPASGVCGFQSFQKARASREEEARGHATP